MIKESSGDGTLYSAQVRTFVLRPQRKSSRLNMKIQQSAYNGGKNRQETHMTMYSPQWKENLTFSPYGSRDIEYFQGMYPQRIKALQKYIMLHCDTLDYKGSPIYDEYPDSLMIDRACEVICSRLPQELSLSAMPGTTVPSDWPEEDQGDPYEGHYREGPQENGVNGSQPVTATALGGPPPGSRPPGGPPEGRGGSPPPGRRALSGRGPGARRGSRGS